MTWDIDLCVKYSDFMILSHTICLTIILCITITRRLNGKFRDRKKVFKRLKKDDSTIIGIKSYHNYIRSHMSLDNTIVDKIEIRGDNKWKTIIKDVPLKNINN